MKVALKIWDALNSEESEAKEMEFDSWGWVINASNPKLLSLAQKFVEQRWAESDYPETTEVNIRTQDGSLIELIVYAEQADPLPVSAEGPMKIKIWNPDHRELHDADEVVIGDVTPEDYVQAFKWAAEDYADKHFARWDYPTETSVHVAYQGEIWEFGIEIRTAPTFHAALKKPK